MITLARHLRAMAYNNAWANRRLLVACGKLTQAEFVAARTSFFPSIAATLNHIVSVDWYYIDALERGFAGAPANTEPARFFEPEQPFEACAPLAAAQREVDRRLVVLCDALDDARLEQTIAIQRSVGLLFEPTHRLLAHLFQHQIHHRGQAHAMLAGTRVPPPQLDEFFCANEAPLRAADLAELGFTEAEIWE